MFREFYRDIEADIIMGEVVQSGLGQDAKDSSKTSQGRLDRQNFNREESVRLWKNPTMSSWSPSYSSNPSMKKHLLDLTTSAFVNRVNACFKPRSVHIRLASP